METALLKVYNNLLLSADSGNCSVLLLDLSAAFDTIDHAVLINRLEKCVAISSVALKWFDSYLSARIVSINIGNSISSLAPIHYGLLSPYKQTHTLRSSDKVLLVIPRSRLKTKGDRAFAIRAPRLRNALPEEIRLADFGPCFIPS